jgi:hypothetical protein
MDITSKQVVLARVFQEGAVRTLLHDKKTDEERLDLAREALSEGSLDPLVSMLNAGARDIDSIPQRMNELEVGLKNSIDLEESLEKALVEARNSLNAIIVERQQVALAQMAREEAMAQRARETEALLQKQKEEKEAAEAKAALEAAEAAAAAQAAADAEAAEAAAVAAEIARLEAEARALAEKEKKDAEKARAAAAARVKVKGKLNPRRASIEVPRRRESLVARKAPEARGKSPMTGYMASLNEGPESDDELAGYTGTSDEWLLSIFKEGTLGSMSRLELFFAPFLAAIQADPHALVSHDDAMLWTLFQLYGRNTDKGALFVSSLNVYQVFNIFRDANLLADDPASSYYVKVEALEDTSQADLWTRDRLDILLRRRSLPGGKGYGNVLSFDEFGLVMKDLREQLLEKNVYTFGFDAAYLTRVLRTVCETHVSAAFLTDPRLGISSSGVCRSGLTTRGSGSVRDNAREVWMMNMDQIRHIYTFYATTVERRRVGRGRSHRMINLDQLRTMLTDFGVLPTYVDLSTFLNMYRDVKLWEWRLCRRVGGADAAGGSLENSPGPRMGRAALSGSPMRFNKPSTSSSSPSVASPVRFPYNIPRVGRDGRVIEQAPKSVSPSPVKKDYRGKDKHSSANHVTGMEVDLEDLRCVLRASMGHMSLSLPGFVEILSRIATHAAMGPTNVAACEGILQVMDLSEGKTKIVRSFSSTYKMRDFVYC